MSKTPTQGNPKQIALALAILAFVAVALLAVWKFYAPTGTAGDRSIQVLVVHADGQTRSFTLNTQQAYLGPALVEGGVVEDNPAAHGLYILTADGETVDEANQEWWKLTKSGELLTTGVDSTPIAGGDVFELTFTTGYDGF